MKNKSNLKVVHRLEKSIALSPDEVYQQLSEIKEDLESIITLLDQQLDGELTFFHALKNRRGDTGKTSIASFG